MTFLLDHKETGRNPIVLFGLATSALLVATTDIEALPLVVWVTWLPCTLALILIFLLNPVVGTRISAEHWICYTSEGRCAIPLSLIDHVQLTSWADGGTSCRVHLCDGRVISVPSDCLPRLASLTRALARAGVTVRVA